MLKEKLNIYLSRKELSKKAIEEVISILKKEDYSSKESIKELVEVLFALKSEVTYCFVCGEFNKIQGTQLEFFIKLCQSAINPNKFNHAFVLAIGLNKHSQTSGYSEIVSYIIQKYVLVKKVNRQIYVAFERALHYDGANCFFQKWIGNNEQVRNGFRVFLIEFLKNYPTAEHVELITKWYEANEIIIHKTEQKAIEGATRQIVEKKEPAAASRCSLQEKGKGDVDLNHVPLSQLLEAAYDNANQLAHKTAELEKENRKLRETDKLLTDRLQSTETLLKKASGENSVLSDKIKVQEEAINDLNRDLDTARQKVMTLEKKIVEINAKLSNVESAYGQAGRQEVDHMIGKIKKLLSSEYAKYTELKEKEPDLDYYVILLDMLDDVYHVLSKNGIKFD